MGNRNKFPRSNKNLLLVSAKAIIRACDPKNPSRITVLRLLGDALHTFQESQLIVDEIKARATSFKSKDATIRLPPGQLDSDSRIRNAHEQGARALFAAVAIALIKLPSRGGSLRRRAIDLIAITGKAAGPAVVLQSVEKMRDHIASLKRLTWSDNERGDFEVVCAILTLAELSSCIIAGRDVARDSVFFLLSPRVRQKCRRSDLTLAIATIVQSFPAHAPPDDRLVDQLLDFCLSPSTLKHGAAGTGSALLVAVTVPYLVSRGPAAADEVTAACGRALKSAPVATERAMWCVAIARSSVTARRSTTFQLRKYGNSETGTRFPSSGNSFNRLPQRSELEAADSDPKVWVSNDTFEEALLQVSDEVGLKEGRVDSYVAVACVLRMWVQALPENVPAIIQRTFSRLLPGLSLASAVSVLVDGIWLGVLKDLKSSQSSDVLDNLLPSLSVQNDISLSAALHVCSLLLQKYKRQCIRESGLSMDYNSVTTNLIKRSHDALDVSSNLVRMGGVFLMKSLISALPRTCSQFLTTVLQNLRIADLSLATKVGSVGDFRTFGSIAFVEQELSSILGNAAALSILIGQICSGECSVPAAFVRQCGVDAMALLRPHQAGDIDSTHGVIAGSIRRRAGWGLISALACGKQRKMFDGDALFELLSMWKEELGYAGQRDSRHGMLNATFAPQSGRQGIEHADEARAPTYDELSALSSTRSAALRALYFALKHVNSTELSNCAKGLMGACGARIVATHSGLSTPTYLGNLVSQGIFEGGTILDFTGDKKKSSVKLGKLLNVEAAYMMDCLSLVPPHGDPGELCYYVAAGLGEEAQKVLGELDLGAAPDTFVMNSASHSPDRNLLFDSPFTNHRSFLSRGLPAEQSIHTLGMNAHLDVRKSCQNQTDSGEHGGDVSWIFSMHGVGTVDAETVLASSAAAMAAIVAEDLTHSGSLIESLLSAKLSPCSSALIALGISQRLSRSDLAEINRALAVLQVLARRALGVTGGIQRTILYESKNGKLYDPNPLGDGYSFNDDRVPGFRLRQIVGANSWLQWASSFSEEGLLGDLPFHDFHSRGIGIMYATRLLAAQTHRELGTTGGPLLWKGLMRKVISVVKENSGSLSSSQSIVLSSSIAALGALLEVVPEPGKSMKVSLGDPRNSHIGDLSNEIDDIADEAVAVLADTIEKGNADAKMAAALALSNCSNRVASVSERIIGSLLRAWAQDTGEFSSLGHVGRCMAEVSLWKRCFGHMWKDMGIRSTPNSARFFSQDSCGMSGCAPALAAGATAVLTSCRLNWWTLTEACYCSVIELSTELLQWSGSMSRTARSAGLYGMTALWASRIDAARAQRLSEANSSFNSLDSFSMAKEDMRDTFPLLPAKSFSLKEPTRLESAVGPFLDEILYEALAPYEDVPVLDGLQAAAAAAVLEIIRGAGVRETCKNIPRLPECLIATVENGSRDAEVLLEILAQSNGKERPKYWFGLCRAVCLNGDRLNFGDSKSVWDVSYRTKAVAIRIARISLECSVANCKCDTSISWKNSEGQVKHTCAYGFLRKIIELVQEVSGTNRFDFVCCGEGCGLLESLSSRIGSSGSEWPENDRTLRDFKEVWDSCFSAMDDLLTDGVPYDVVNSAGLALSELLVSSLRLSGMGDTLSANGRATSFLSKSAGHELRDRFLYSDQGEEVGLRAKLAAVSRYAKVVTTLRVIGEGSETVPTSSRELFPTKRLIFSVLDDFVSTLRAEGLSEIAKSGGTLTTGLIEEQKLQSAMYGVIVPLVLGAISCIGVQEDVDDDSGEFAGSKSNFVGLSLAEGGKTHDSVAIACFVWLLKRAQGESVSVMRRQLMGPHCQEALINLCLTNVIKVEDIREVLLSYSQLTRNGYLEFTNRISRLPNLHRLRSDVAELVITIALTVIAELANDELHSDAEMKCQVVSKGLQGVGHLLSSVIAESNGINDSVYVRSLDAAFQIVCMEEAGIDLYDDVQFQQMLCEFVEICLHRLRESPKVCELICLKVRDTFSYGQENQSIPHIRISLVLSALLSKSDITGARTLFIQMLLAPITKSASVAVQRIAMGVTLCCYGIEKELSRIIQSADFVTEDESGDGSAVPVSEAIAQGIGKVGLSNDKSNVLPALRLSSIMLSVGGSEDSAFFRSGALLYSILLPKLVELLPDKLDGIGENGNVWNKAKLLAESKQQPQVFKEIVDEMPEEQRSIIDLLMKRFESEES